ncbi:Profilin [Cooperia oncophora]
MESGFSLGFSLRMSSGWQAYITSMTESSPSIKRAAIVSLADGSVWARTQGTNAFKDSGDIGFQASEAELKKFVALFDKLADVPSTGADLEEVHYIVPRTEDNLIFGKKEKCGFFAAKTKTVVLIAIYEGENQVSAEVRTAVEKMAKYLEDTGY